MDPVRPGYNAHLVEADVLGLWRARRLPPPGGVLGPPTGPIVRQYLGSWTQGDFPSLVAHRAVAADVDARYFGLVGRRSVATLRHGTGAGPATPSAVPSLLTSLGVWTGGDGSTPWDEVDRSAGVQAIVGRLASKGIIATRDEAFRMCPTCGTPRSPERIVYEEREGDTCLVRFPIRAKELTVNALVWVDVPWKLLGTSALLVNPDVPYVIAGYRRREDRELVLTSKASLERLQTWIPEATLEIVEERAGRSFQGTAYSYPLRHEFPIGGDLAAPAGTIIAAADVTDTGTGIVPLVPGHGPTDGRIAGRIGVNGWPLVTPKGKLDFTLLHKYAGLDLESANEFVLRDLAEAGALLARLRVKRGVPLCAICGTALLWAPGRAWCLEPSHLPPERRELFARVLPEESLPGASEVGPWPVSETLESDDPSAVSLLECAQCDRLEAPGGPTACPCGGTRRLVRRHLLPSSDGAFAAWARFDPMPDGDAIHLYVGYRRRVPALIHHLAALAGIQGIVGEVNLTLVPTVAAADAAALTATYGADAVRAALIRSSRSEAVSGNFAERCGQESERIRRWWQSAREVADQCDASMLAAFSRPIGGFLGELEVEDRAVIARWERTRTLALAHYDHFAPALVHRRVFRFFENDLRDYRELVGPRLALVGAPTTKRAALRTLAHLLRGLSEVLAPILPFTSEAIHRMLSSERTSLFEQPVAGLDRALVNDDLVAAWDRWEKVLRSVARFRRAQGVPRSTMIPSAVLVVPADDLGDKFRTDRDTVARLAGIQKLEIASPREPWTGRQRAVRPIESEIQKAYPAQASQIVHLLQRMPPRRWETAAGQEELTVVINGLPRRVFPNMVAFSDTLPERVVPTRCSIGELYVELPSSAGSARANPPPLSADAFWVVRRIERRLRAAGPTEGARDRIALVTAKEPLAVELRSAAEAIARFLGLRELRVVEKSEEPIPPNAIVGRTRTGDRWWAHVPGLPGPRARAKRPRSGARLQRVSVAGAVAPVEFDYGDEAFVAHEEEVRALGQELDGLIGLPLLGPSKVANAWEHGIHSVDDLRHAPFETLSALPGFGGPVAEVVVTKLGGKLPSSSLRRTAPTALPPRPRSESPGPVERRPGPLTEAPPRPAPAPIAARAVAVPPPVTERRAAAVEPPSPIPNPPGVVTETTPELGPVESPEPVSPPVKAEPIAPSMEPPVSEAVTPSSTPPSEGTPSVPEGSPPASAEAASSEPVFPVPPPDSGSQEPSPEPTAEPTVGLPEPDETESTFISSEEERTSSSPEEVVSTGPVPEPESEPEVVPPDISPAEPEVAPPEVIPPELEVAPPDTAPAEPEVAPPEVIPPELEVASPDTAPAEPEVAPPENVLPEPEVTHPEVAPAEPQSEPTAPASDHPVEVPPSVTDENRPPEPPAGEAALPAGVERSSAAPEEPPPEEESPSGIEAAEVAPAEVSESSEIAPEESAIPEEPVPPAPSVPSEIAEPASNATASRAPEEPSGPAGSEVEPASPAPASTEEGTATVPAPVEPAVPVVVAEPPRAPVPAPPVELPVSGAPPEAPTEPEPPSPPSGVELLIGDSLVTSLSGFLEAASAGHHGVCVVRESPERIRARVGSRPVEVYWLTNIGRGPALRPSDLEGAWTFLTRKLIDERVTAFFLEGVEYLVRLHGADAVLNGLVEFDRLARENDARIWIYLAPSLLRAEDMDRFRGTFPSMAPAR